MEVCLHDISKSLITNVSYVSWCGCSSNNELTVRLLTFHTAQSHLLKQIGFVWIWFEFRNIYCIILLFVMQSISTYCWDKLSSFLIWPSQIPPKHDLQKNWELWPPEHHALKIQLLRVSKYEESFDSNEVLSQLPLDDSLQLFRSRRHSQRTRTCANACETPCGNPGYVGLENNGSLRRQLFC